VDHQTTTGDRVRDVRKRRGLGQRQLSDLSGVSISLVRKLEQGSYGTVRLETLHKLAVTLRVPTTTLAARPDAVEPGNTEVEQWQEARRALEGRPDETPPEEQPTVDGMAAAARLAVNAIIGNRHADLHTMLPRLLRDADALVADSASDTQTEVEARRQRSQVRQMTAYIMAQTWQFDSAGHAIELASDDAGDGLTAKAALDWKCWVLLRQGALAQARDLAAHWSDAAEPRLSRASREELAAWGRFLLRLSTAAARDNRPGEAKDALKLARVAAVASGNDFILPYNPWQAFGPMAVSMIQAENATIQDRPDITLAIAVQLQGRRFPVPRLYHRHRLDVAHAHAAMRQHSEAVTVLHEIRRDAPEWLAQQRYARDILNQIIGRRRTLTPEMRDLADFLHLAL
jgi:transcriptional regulator with XRE-family HTH domain